MSSSSTLQIKRKRRPPGTPDPDADVISLPPQTLLESGRYVCDICHQGFQRDQNLQMHRRRHRVPWKLPKKEPPPAAAGGPGAGSKKQVFVCPEPSCLHHDPGHALGDLVGIKKHYRRKHSDRRQWVCGKCERGYAVQSDYKAHVRTCGSRGHTCDCGKVFSRVESFIEHQDNCNINRSQQLMQIPRTNTLSRSHSSPTPSKSNDTNLSSSFLQHNLKLQLVPTTSTSQPTQNSPNNDNASNLNLSLGLSNDSFVDGPPSSLQEAKRQVELAEQEFANAKRIRQQAQAELEKAFIIKEHATKSINSILLQITCQSCKLNMWPKPK